MAKVKKATKEEIKSVQDANDKLNQEIYNLGMLEHNKTKHLESIKLLQSEFTKIQNDLEDKYGKVTIDLNTGEISDIKKDETD